MDPAFDPVLLGFHDGSLQQQLAYGMNVAMDNLRANTVRSIEEIMINQVTDYIDGQGACTRVDCLL
jgi:hypothetical protein